ncbi:hypothetical protein OF83DRAFT_1168216 [Amylostereum chailletii]|nr:hypothetical protein OF83DRAFT_1168216 [Amylostereum chailletii]
MPALSPDHLFLQHPAEFVHPANDPSQLSYISSPSDEDGSFSDSSPARPSLRSKPSSDIPDPSQYLFTRKSPSILPPLSSSSSSTRSSSNTSSALVSGDYNHVRLSSSEEGNSDGIGLGITSDDVVHVVTTDVSGSQSRLPIDQTTRWSQSYSASLRSRSSLVRSNSINGHNSESASSTLHRKQSYDLSWQPVDEREEVDLTSEDETDDIDTDDDMDMDDDDDDDREEERTAAILIAEEGRGQIVRGDGIATVKLQVNAGTTHLLVGSSSTPNAIPLFLSVALPSISTTLLALDISCNFLGALPPALESCANLEELNISSNPLRALPVFIAELRSLRVLISDSTGITTLPPPLSALERLHTLSIRRNKMYALPNWLCLLPSLETLLVDGNPFQGPWKALVDPLLAKETSGPLYPPSTPMFPLPSATSVDSEYLSDNDAELSDSPVADVEAHQPSTEEEDTIMPSRAPIVRASSSPLVESHAPARGVTRTRTTPNRSYFDRNREETPSPSRAVSQHNTRKVPDSGYFGDHEIRRMKSAGELRRDPSTSTPPSSPPVTFAGASLSPPRPSTNYASSSSSLVTPEVLPPRFASLGAATTLRNGYPRPPLNNAFDQPATSTLSEFPIDASRTSSFPSRPPTPPSAPPPSSSRESPDSHAEKLAQRQRAGTERKLSKDKEKSGRWGFLRKMSMGKLRSDSPSSRPSTSQGRANVTPLLGIIEPPLSASPALSRMSSAAKIDVRLSSTGALGLDLPAGSSSASIPPAIIEPDMESESETEPPPSSTTIHASASPSPSPSPSPNPSASNFLAPAPSSGSSPSFLIPPSPNVPTSRSAKRRSFLPIDGSNGLSIPVPSPTAFVTGFAVGSDDGEGREYTPSPTPESFEQIQRREEERAREAYTRALRSVMAYLRDMNDLSLSQINTTSIMTPASPESGTRSRRPTVSENGRTTSENSVAMSSSSASIGSPGSGQNQLRSSESIARLRSVSTSKTASIVTTDSGGSNGGETRKFKDDGAKRALIVREIVETERTYVKGLQELIDIYIKPASAPVNVLGASTKETIVPAAERRVVFGGVDSLFHFHKDSFLPALEYAVSPIMKPAATLAQEDPTSRLSLTAASAVANAFVSHAAFMKMYSTYINNFDNSVDRLKHWTTHRPSAGASTPPTTLSPASSSAQIASIGLAISGINPNGMSPDPTNTLSASQKKRIKTYLKRCRLNPRHSQLNLEGYLLLPVQRIPRYKLLLEELGRSTPPIHEYEDPLDKALAEIASLATNMNEGKRESEGRRKLVQWQARIRGRFPSPLVQPHRRLIMDGPLLLTRVVRKATIAFEVINSQGDMSNVQVECLSPEQTPRSLVGILCNDLLVLCRDPSEGTDPASAVDLWAVLRMQTLPQPASIVHGNVLRLVDNKAILYFEASSTSDALTWFRAINLHIPTKT